MRCQSHISKDVDPYVAGYMLGERFRPMRPELVLLFPSVHYQDFSELQQGLHDGLEREGDGALVFGATGDGYYASDDIGSHGVSAMALAGDGKISWRLSIETGVGQDSAGAARRCARRLVDEAGAVPSMAMVFSDGISGDGVKIIEGISAVFEVPFIGGTCGDDRRFERGFVIADGSGHRDAVGILGFFGEVAFSMNVASGWRPIGDAARVERVKDNVICSIGGRSALDYIGRELGRLPSEVELALFPLAVYTDEERFVLRAALSWNTTTGEATMAGSVPEASVVRVSQATVADILGGVDQALADMTDPDFDPCGALVFSCAARKWILGAKCEEETGRLYARIGKRVPLAGVPVYGEYCPFRVGDDRYTATYFHNETYVVLLLGGR